MNIFVACELGSSEKIIIQNNLKKHNLYNKIWQYKQENTIIATKEKFTYDKNLCNMLKKLKAIDGL